STPNSAVAFTLPLEKALINLRRDFACGHKSRAFYTGDRNLYSSSDGLCHFALQGEAISAARKALELLVFALAIAPLPLSLIHTSQQGMCVRERWVHFWQHFTRRSHADPRSTASPRVEPELRRGASRICRMATESRAYGGGAGVVSSCRVACS